MKNIYFGAHLQNKFNPQCNLPLIMEQTLHVHTYLISLLNSDWVPSGIHWWRISIHELKTETNSTIKEEISVTSDRSNRLCNEQGFPTTLKGESTRNHQYIYEYIGSSREPRTGTKHTATAWIVCIVTVVWHPSIGRARRQLRQHRAPTRSAD